MIQSEVHRNVGHPWHGRPGWDLLIARFESEAQRDQYVAAAARKFWQPWICGHAEDTGQPSAVLYKPSGANAPWSDTPT